MNFDCLKQFTTTKQTLTMEDFPSIHTLITQSSLSHRSLMDLLQENCRNFGISPMKTSYLYSLIILYISNKGSIEKWNREFEFPIVMEPVSDRILDQYGFITGIQEYCEWDFSFIKLMEITEANEQFNLFIPKLAKEMETILNDRNYSVDHFIQNGFHCFHVTFPRQCTKSFNYVDSIAGCSNQADEVSGQHLSDVILSLKTRSHTLFSEIEDLESFIHNFFEQKKREFKRCEDDIEKLERIFNSFKKY